MVALGSFYHIYSICQTRGAFGLLVFESIGCATLKNVDNVDNFVDKRIYLDDRFMQRKREACMPPLFPDNATGL